MPNWFSYETVAGGITSALCECGVIKSTAQKIAAFTYIFLVFLAIVCVIFLTVHTVFDMKSKQDDDIWTASTFGDASPIIGSNASITDSFNITREYPETKFSYSVLLPSRATSSGEFETIFQIIQRTPLGIPPQRFLIATRNGMFKKCSEKIEDQTGYVAISENVTINQYVYVCLSDEVIDTDQDLFKFNEDTN